MCRRASVVAISLRAKLKVCHQDGGPDIQEEFVNLYRLGSVCLSCCVFAVLFAFSAVAEEPSTYAPPDHKMYVGYSGMGVNGNLSRVSEWRYDESSRLYGLDVTSTISGTHFSVEGAYNNSEDYRFVGHLDLAGKLKLNLESEQFWHNLDHIPYLPGAPGSRPESTTTRRLTYEDANPDDDYGVSTQIESAEVIAKLGDNPAHVRLKYWRLEKDGTRQLRFVDKGHDLAGIGTPVAPATGNCDSCHLASSTRQVRRVTEEISGGVDAHVGFFDVAVEQLFRVFRVKDPTPEYEFFGLSYSPVDVPRTYQHSEDPESTLLQSTVKVRTALSGGLVGEGAYTYGLRKNNSKLSELDNLTVESNYQKVASDISYTPVESLTLRLRFRLLDLNTDTPSAISAAYIRTANTTWPVALPVAPDTTIAFPVRENIDLTRYQYAASATWRPIKKLTIKGDAQREIIYRSNIGEATTPYSATNSPIDRLGAAAGETVWGLPDQEIIDQFRLGVTIRPLATSALKINTWYRYMHSDNPAYAASFEDKQEVFAGVNYSGKANWGLNASAKGTLEENNGFQHAVWDTYRPATDATRVSDVAYESTDRKKTQQNYALGFWLNPFNRVTAGVNGGYMRAKIEQDLLFGGFDLNRDYIGWYNTKKATDYIVDTKNVSAYMNLQVTKTVSTRLEGYYLVSESTFKTNFNDTFIHTDNTTAANVTTTTSTSTELEQISKLDFVQQGISAGIDWEPADQWVIGLTYAFDDYNARNSDIYDGTTQSLTGSLAYSW